MHFLMGYVSYALSANIYFGLYFFIFLIGVIANRVSNLRPLWAAKWRIDLESTSIEIWFFTSFFFLFVWLLRNICRHSHWWIHFYLKQLFHHLFGDSLIFVCLILSILVLVVFGRISGVLCNVEPFLSVNIIVFYQITPINQLFACMYS